MMKLKSVHLTFNQVKHYSDMLYEVTGNINGSNVQYPYNLCINTSHGPLVTLANNQYYLRTRMNSPNTLYFDINNNNYKATIKRN